MPDIAIIKYLFNIKYERHEIIIDKVIIITEETEKISIYPVTNIVKIQYNRIINCPAGKFKIILPFYKYYAIKYNYLYYILPCLYCRESFNYICHFFILTSGTYNIKGIIVYLNV